MSSELRSNDAEGKGSMRVDRISLIRLAMVFAVGCGLAVSIPGGGSLFVGKGFLLVTAFTAGLLVMRWRESGARVRSGFLVPARVVIGVWAASLSLALLGGTMCCRSSDAWLLGMSLPPPSLAIRTLPQLALVGFLLAVLSQVPPERRKEIAWNDSLRLLVFLGVVVALAWTTKMPSREYIALWANQVPAHVRFEGLLDLCNSLWLGAIVPLAILRGQWSEFVERLLSASFLCRSGWTRASLLPWVLVPVGFLINVVTAPHDKWVDSLPWEWWLRKTLSVGMWTGYFEEVVYRVVVLVVLLPVVQEERYGRIGRITAVLLSAIVFTLVHLNLSWPSILMSSIAGLVLGGTLVRSGNLETCVLCHTAYDVLVVSWSPS